MRGRETKAKFGRLGSKSRVRSGVISRGQERDGAA